MYTMVAGDCDCNGNQNSTPWACAAEAVDASRMKMVDGVECDDVDDCVGHVGRLRGLQRPWCDLRLRM